MPLTDTGNAPVSSPYLSELSKLSNEPVVIIEPARSWAGLNPRLLWTHRELLYFLALRDLKVRYKQTALGIIWVILQPLLMTVIFTLFLGRAVQVPSENLPYALFVYAGVVLWTFFSGAVSSTGNSLVGNSHLITKVYFPRFILPIAAIIARLVDLAVSLVILVGFFFYYRINPGPRMFLVPFFILLLSLLALGLGMWLSAINVKYRDVGLALPVLIQLWMFASPVVYPTSLIPERFQALYSLNPMVGVLQGFRAAIFDRPFDWPSIAVSAIFASLFLLYAAYAFRNRERTFADVI